MNKTNKLLIDADFILWKILPNKKQTPEEIEQYGDYSQRTLEDIQNGLDWFINEKILVPTNADEYIGFIGGYGNFRKELAPITYKANRVDMELPRWFNEAKEYLVEKWGFIKVDGMESEDAVGITLTQYPDSIVVRVDHDLDQLEGTHFNPNKEELKIISEKEAIYNQWKQCLTGCVSDKVAGIPKIGEVKSSKILEEIHFTKYQQEVLQQYLNYFGEYEGVKQFSLNYQLLKILREKEDFIIPTFTKVDKVCENITIDF
jgi:5'-3' exonuclease